jgi:hypothetical protein
MQGRGGTNALGLKERPPFTVSRDRDPHCNHTIPLAAPVPHDHHWGTFMNVFADPLVQAMLPVPKVDAGLYYLADTHPKLQLFVWALTRLSSPIYASVVPISTMDLEKLSNEVGRTNVQTLVVSGLEAKHSELLHEMAPLAAAGPRKVLFVGAADAAVPPNVHTLTTSILDFDYYHLSTLPLENLGAAIVRRFMRGEWPIDPSGTYDHGRATRAARSAR